MSKLKDDIKETKNNLKMSWQFIKNKKKSLILMAILSIILSAISVVAPILSAKLLLKLTNGLLEELIYIALFIFIVEICRNIVSTVLQKITQIYMIKAVTDAQLAMFTETLKISTSEIDKNSSGTFIDRIKNDTNDIINIFSDLVNYFVDFISNVGILMAVLIVSPYMFIYFIVTSLILGYIDRKRRNIYFDQSKRYRKIREKSTGLASEFIRGIRDVKLLNGKNGILTQIKKEMDIVNNERISLEQTSLKFRLLSGNIRDFFDVTFIILGVILVSNNLISIANLLVIHMYRGKLENLLNFYNRLIELIKHYNLSATRVFEVLGDYFLKEDASGLELSNLKGKIEFRNVSFSYDDNVVLKNIDFIINPGEKTGFVGASGSGKSTIFNLITKLYPLEKGNIYIDDIDIKEINYNSLRNNLALIPQNPYIFNFSIMDNLRIANQDAKMEDIIEACKKADIYDRIMEFEHGFDTEIGEGGVILSGGEKQRLAIARSLIKGSNVLLFDEATSALDNITQDKIQTSIYKLGSDKTVLIIAHRLSTIINCDKIVVIDKGKIVDIGTHQELLERCQKYQKLFKYENAKDY